ncbi:hypothetical protein [Microlunatus speluncae]|uniref:hypothetical protein n=1 Tax=Microlunatus speluncae TaxID=2594267 RepID=UPI0012663330|nr:hypothetical protein [Microlunatus speluncae]
MDAISIIMIIFFGFCVSLGICGHLACSWLTRPATVRITGRIPDMEEWLPQAMHRSAIAHYSSARWGSQCLIMQDRGGRPTKYLAVLLGNQGEYRVEVELPPYTAGTYFTAEFPLVATVTLITYLYSGSWPRRLFFGKWPDKIAIIARARVIRQLRKHARRAARELSYP